MCRSNDRGEDARVLAKFLLAVVFGLFATASAAAQDGDLTLGVTYVCSGDHVFIESCSNDHSDSGTCMVGHPDHVMANGLMQYTNMTRGALKALLPTCTQPSAKQTAAAQAFQKRQQDAYNANVQKANDQMKAATQPATYGQPQKPKTAEQRAITRCVTSGRLAATCTGNSLMGAFGQMLGQVLPGADKQPAPGPEMAGVFEGAGRWRLDFIDGGVLVNCSFLSPNQESYTIDFKSGRPMIVIDTRPKPLVLTLRADGTIVGPGPVVIDGVVPGGSTGGGSTPGHTESHQVTTTQVVTATDARAHAGDPNLVNQDGGYALQSTTTQSTYVPGTYTPAQTTFAPRRTTCPALNLSSKGAGVGVQTMQTDLLKSVFSDGEKGAPTPAGIRMHGIFAASTGFSVQFFPESAVLGCGPDAARAYPYTVEADGGKAVVRINAPDHPLSLAFGSGGSLDPGATGPYQVHGRTVTGQNDNDDFTFAPFEQTCNLAVLTPSATIPSGGGSAGVMVTSTASPAANGTRPSGAGAAPLSTPNAPTGPAILSVSSGFPAQGGVPNPLAGRPYILLRDSYADALAKGGVSVPAGVSPYKYAGNACGNKTPDCQKISEAIKAEAASAVRADASGSGTFPGVAPGVYYLMISTRYNNQGLVWGQAVQLKPGTNSVTLAVGNATPVN